MLSGEGVSDGFGAFQICHNIGRQGVVRLCMEGLMPEARVRLDIARASGMLGGHFNQ